MPPCRHGRIPLPASLAVPGVRSGRLLAAPTAGAVGDGAFDAGTERADVGIGPYGVRSAVVRPARRCARFPCRSIPDIFSKAF